jgi:3-oxoadipate enol-lactonase
MRSFRFSPCNGLRHAHKPSTVAILETFLGTVGFSEQGSGPIPIIFLHGVGSDKSVWAPQLDHFGRARRAVAFDYPGYGESIFLEGASRDDFAAAILAAMERLDIARAHICGLSLGGVVAIAMHSAAPERCASLILADTFAVHPDGSGIYERSVAASTDLRALAEARVDLLLAQPADPDMKSEVVETMARIHPAAYRIGAEAVWLADQRERARAVHVPTLVICGSEDQVTPPELSLELVDLIEGARYEQIDGAGHLSNLERPAAFNRIVDAFLAQVESRQ